MRQRGTPLRYWRATLVIVQMRQTRSNPAKNKQGLLCPLGELYVSYSVSATKIIITKDKSHWRRKNAVYNNAEPTSPLFNKCIHHRFRWEQVRPCEHDAAVLTLHCNCD